MENRKSKSLLVRILTVICALCCSLAVVCGLVGCGEAEKTVQSVTVNASQQIVITYTDGTVDKIDMPKGAQGEQGPAGPQGGTLDADCDHTYALYVAQHGTCVNEEVDVKICTACNGYEVVLGEKDFTRHGTFEYELNDGVLEYVLKQDVTVHEQTQEEKDSHACPEKTCNLCGQDLQAHDELVWKDVIENANKCTEEHLQVQTCKKCLAVVSSVQKKPAIGHKYAYVSDNYAAVAAATNGKVAEFTVNLTCEECGEDTTVKAVYAADKSKAVTCLEGGFDMYTYSYEYSNGEAPETKTADLKKNEQGKSLAHTFLAESGESITAELDELVSYNFGNADALDALFADPDGDGEKTPVLETIAGVSQDCRPGHEVSAVGRCDVCKTMITIMVSGKHTYADNTYVAPTCTVDGYLPCKVCGDKYVDETKDLAQGHVYTYVDGTYNSLNNTVTVECKNCTPVTRQTASVVFVERVNAVNCAGDTYDLYKTTGLSNGILDVNHPNYVADVAVECKVVDADAVKNHVLEANGYKITDLVLSDEVDANGDPYVISYNANIATALTYSVEKGGMEWRAGDAGSCTTHKIAVFRCTCCKTMITINLMGAHHEVGEMKTEAASCAMYGYKYKTCDTPNCLAGGKVVYEYLDPIGHNYEVVDKAAFLASAASAVKGQTQVAVKCSIDGCGHDNVATLTEIEAIPGNSACYPNDITRYTFKAEYQVTIHEATGDASATWYDEDIQVDSEDLGESHRIAVGGIEIDDIKLDENYSSDDYFVKALLYKVDDGGIEWIAGIPGDCKNYKPAVFRCADCKTMITINLSGAHQLDGQDIVTYPTCTTGGTTHQTCLVAGCPNTNNLVEIVSKRVPALGHNYEWEITGLKANYDNDGVFTSIDYGTVTGTCTRENCPNKVVTATATPVVVEQNCCNNATVSINYIYDVDGDGVAETVLTKALTIAPSGAHEYTDASNNAVPPHGGEIVVKYVEDNKEYTLKWCYSGQKFVLQSVVDVPQA